MRHRARIDDNQQTIVSALEAMGWLVKSTAQLGNGFPDLVIAKHGRLVLVEVKDGSKSPSRRQLTEDEIGCHLHFKAHGVDVLLIACVDDLAILDRDARSKYEGVPERNFYK